MSRKTAKYLGSLLATASLIVSPLEASAGGMSHVGTINRGGMVPGVNCRPGSQPASVGAVGSVNRPLNVYTRNIDASKNTSVYKPVNIRNNIDASKNTSINKSVNVHNNIDASKNINVYKPVEINKNIDASKNTSIYKPITINKNIDASKNTSIYKPVTIIKNIDNSKNINIEKNITINKGGHGGSDSSSSSEAAAIAAAVAAAFASSSSSSSAVVNFNGGSNTAYGGNSYANASTNAGSESYASAFGYSGAGTVSVGSSFSESFSGGSGGGGGGDIGNISVSAPTPVAAACTFQDTTVIKAIHAVCVSADSHEFPASHMVGDTWLDAGYEGEIARCLPGSHLKVILGAVFQSNEGMASNWTNGQTLECGAHEALRHMKGGMLKCAAAMPVPDCTERTNLRKFGTGDMFFTYRAKVCMETHQEYVASRE